MADKYSASYKFEVVLQLLSNEMTAAGTARAFNLPPEIVRRWKRTFEENGPTLFDRDEMLEKQEEEIDQLRRDVIEAHEQERRKIGEAIHDDLGQYLTSIRLMLKELISSLEQESSDHAQMARDIFETAKRADRVARNLSRYTPIEVEAETLSDALEDLSHDVERAYGVHAEQSTAKLLRRLIGCWYLNYTGWFRSRFKMEWSMEAPLNLLLE